MISLSGRGSLVIFLTADDSGDAMDMYDTSSTPNHTHLATKPRLLNILDLHVVHSHVLTFSSSWQLLSISMNFFPSDLVSSVYLFSIIIHNYYIPFP